MQVAKVSQHYDDAYFSWQKTIGEFGGWACLTMFADYIKPADRVLDFGCGGGYLLSRIDMHKWPMFYTKIAKYLGRTGFEICCRIYGWMKRDVVQVRTVAVRPDR